MNILDIDLDFFLDVIEYMQDVTSTVRLDENEYHPWSEARVKKFLENCCNLNPNNKINGKYFTHHHELFYFLGELQEKNNYSLKFDIDHIDGHADLGLGDRSYVYICTELLHYPVDERIHHIDETKKGNLSAGNFLAFLAACGWLKRLTYIHAEGEGTDIAWMHLKDFDESSGFLQLKKYSKIQMNHITNGDMFDRAKKTKPLVHEPDIPFRIISEKNFISNKKYDYVFITQSPAFTPKTSDDLLPTFFQYINIINET